MKRSQQKVIGPSFEAEFAETITSLEDRLEAVDCIAKLFNESSRVVRDVQFLSGERQDGKAKGTKIWGTFLENFDVCDIGERKLIKIESRFSPILLPILTFPSEWE